MRPLCALRSVVQAVAAASWKLPLDTTNLTPAYRTGSEFCRHHILVRDALGGDAPMLEMLIDDRA